MSRHMDSAPPAPKPRQGGTDVRMSALFRLDKRTIVVTGGTGGIGARAVEAILESGGDVVVLDRHSSPPTDIWTYWEELGKRYETQIAYAACDLTDEHGAKDAIDEIKSNIRYPIRGLLACVGQSDTGPSITYTPSNFRRLLEVNVIATFVAAQAVAAAMQTSNSDGSMVLIASMSGHVVNKGADSSAYNSAKSAVLQLGRNLAAEWGAREDMPLIRVNTLSPGYVRTAATENALTHAGMEERWSGQNMLHRLCFPDELRGPVVYLLSEASSFMTGADVRIDGGHCAW